MLFDTHNLTLTHIPRKAHLKEKEIQELIEANLEMLLNLEYVRSEFTIQGDTSDLRIDTLAFDKETKSFVIIEYKRDKSSSLIEQGYAYLAVMLKRQAEFLIEYNEQKGGMLRRDDIDWSQSRIIFVAKDYDARQLEVASFKDLPFSLYRAELYENGLFSFESVKVKKSSASIKMMKSKNEVVKQVESIIKVYAEEDHLKMGSEVIQDMYKDLKARCLDLEEVRVEAKKIYIGFYTNKASFMSVVFQKKRLVCYLNLPFLELKDPYNLAKDVTKKNHNGVGNVLVSITPDSDMDEIMSLIRQAYKYRK